MPRLIEDLLVGRATVAEPALQSARAHVELFGDFLLGRLHLFEPLHQDVPNARLDVIVLESGQVLERYGVAMSGQLRIAPFEWAFHGRAVEDRPVVGRVKSQRGSQQTLEVIDLGRSRRR